MTTESAYRSSLWKLLKVAVRKAIVRKQLKYAQECYEAEKQHAAQAEANAQFFKLRAGRLKFKLEDLNRAPE